MNAVKILYFSDSRFPLAALAGAIHTGRLRAGELPDRRQLRELLSLNIKGGKNRIIPLGEDRAGNKVYALSIKGERGMAHRLVESFLRIYDFQKDEVRMADNRLTDNVFLWSGKLLYSFAPLTTLGCLLIRIGVKQLYGELTGWALAVKAAGANHP